jgi:hypothetical protein
MTRTIDIQSDEYVVGFNDLNRLYDAVEYFKPMTVASYAKTKGVSVQSVYKRIKNEKLVTINIDGITFIIL